MKKKILKIGHMESIFFLIPNSEQCRIFLHLLGLCYHGAWSMYKYCIHVQSSILI